MTTTEMLVACIGCGQQKPVTEFFSDIRRPRGCMSRCKKCAVAVRREWARKNPEAHLAHVSKWRTANPEKVKLARRRNEGQRRARKRDAAYERIDPLVVLERDGHLCGICGEEIEGDFHIDHVIPLVKGGPHLYENVQAAHPRCNIKKGAK